MGPSQQSQVADACRFNPGVWRLGLEEQAAFIRNCVEILGAAYREEARARLELIRWINEE
jgi:hypothetical protein